MRNNIIDRLKLPFRKEKELFSALYDILGFYPRDIHLYKQALLHKSIEKRNDKGRPVNNERLEFLGDAVLDAIGADIVFHHFQGKGEGFLTNTRSKLVQRETLNKLAEEMGIRQLLLSSCHNMSHNNNMGGNAFEALVGAVYLDRGYRFCMLFMRKRVLDKLVNIDKLAKKEVNFKSKLIEWCQRNKVMMSFQQVRRDNDKEGNPRFTYRIDIEGIRGESGDGFSKKESQQKAARATLQRLRREPQLAESIFDARTERKKKEEEQKKDKKGQNDKQTGEEKKENAGSGLDKDLGVTPTIKGSRRKDGERKDGERKDGERKDGERKNGERKNGERKKRKEDETDDDRYDYSRIGSKTKDEEDIIEAAETAAFST